MKKQIVFALAALTMVAQAQAQRAAAPARPAAPHEVRVENKENKGTEARDVRTGGAATAETRQASTQLESLVKSPTEKRAVNELLADAKATDLRELLTEIAKNTSPEVAELNAEVVRGAIRLKNVERETNGALDAMDPAVRLGKSYVALVTKVGLEAQGWSKETRDTATALLRAANNKISANMSLAQMGQALKSAAAEVEAQLKIKINIDEIVARCK